LLEAGNYAEHEEAVKNYVRISERETSNHTGQSFLQDCKSKLAVTLEENLPIKRKTLASFITELFRE
jgi:hypothetical protein